MDALLEIDMSSEATFSSIWTSQRAYKPTSQRTLPQRPGDSPTTRFEANHTQKAMGTGGMHRHEYENGHAV